jgi:hypothetical protein
MGPPADRGQVDRPGEAGLDQWSDDKVRIRHAELREEAKPETRLDHSLDPVVTR